MKKNEMDETCSTHDRDENYIHNFDPSTAKEYNA